MRETNDRPGKIKKGLRRAIFRTKDSHVPSAAYWYETSAAARTGGNKIVPSAAYWYETSAADRTCSLPKSFVASMRFYVGVAALHLQVF